MWIPVEDVTPEPPRYIFLVPVFMNRTVRRSEVKKILIISGTMMLLFYGCGADIKSDLKIIYKNGVKCGIAASKFQDEPLDYCMDLLQTAEQL